MRGRCALAHAEGSEETVWVDGRIALLSDVRVAVSPHVLLLTHAPQCVRLAIR